MGSINYKKVNSLTSIEYTDTKLDYVLQSMIFCLQNSIFSIIIFFYRDRHFLIPLIQVIRI